MTNMKSLIESLEGLLESGWQLPMSGGKIMVNAKDFKNIIDEMKNSLPEEILQAKKIVKDRLKIIEDAREKSEFMLKTSEEKIRELVSRNEIVKSAQASAEQIISDANYKSKEIRASADDYATKLMENLEDSVNRYLDEIRKIRGMFKSENNIKN